MKTFWSAAFLIEPTASSALPVPWLVTSTRRVTASPRWATPSPLHWAQSSTTCQSSANAGRASSPKFTSATSCWGRAPWSSKNFTVMSSRRLYMSFGTFTGAFQVRFSPGLRVPKRNSRRSSSGSSLSVQPRIRDSGSLPRFSTVTSRSKLSPGASRLSGPGRSVATS